DALLGRIALRARPLAILPVDRAALIARLRFEIPARDLLVAVDERGRLVAAYMAVDVRGEPFAAGMRRPRKTPGDVRPRRMAGEQHCEILGSRNRSGSIAQFCPAAV